MSEASFRQGREDLLHFLAKDINSILAGYPLDDLKDKRLLLTGATGFVGRWLLLAIKCLNDAGSAIKVIALSRNPEHFLKSFPEWEDVSWLTWISGDIRDFQYPTLPIDAIIHGATDTSPQLAIHNPAALYESMVQGTERILHFAKNQEIPRILLISSGAIYGEQPTDLHGLNEDFSPVQGTDQDPYGEGKRAMEQLGAHFATTYGLEIIIARCFTFVGFGLAKHLAISQFIRDAQENPEIAVKGDGQTVRSYLYAADLALWLLTILARGKPGQAYNVGSPNAVTLIETATRVRNLLAPAKQIIILGADASAPRRRYVPDTTRAENELKLRVWTELDQALQKTAATTALCSSKSN
jgi:dTDP-glucose 4,6-dehydratase